MKDRCMDSMGMVQSFSLHFAILSMVLMVSFVFKFIDNYLYLFIYLLFIIQEPIPANAGSARINAKER